MAQKVNFSPSGQAWDMQASPQQIDQTCGLGKGVNLLDNSWWARKELIVNQRGLTQYDGNIYGIDRWKGLAGGSMSIGDNFLLLKEGSSGVWAVSQKLPPGLVEAIRGKPLVLSLLSADGKLASVLAPVALSQNYSIIKDGIAAWLATNGVIYLGASTTETKVVAAKLELGTEQTLAVQNPDGFWVLAEPAPNYALELLKCQRYLHPFGGTGGFWQIGWLNQGYNTIHIPYPPVIGMRTNPTLVVMGGDTNTYLNNITLDGNGKRTSMGTGSFTGISFDQRDSRVSLTLSSSGKNLVSSLASHVVAVWTSTATSRMFMSAEL